MLQNMTLIREGIKRVPILKYAFGLSVIAACLQLAVGVVGGNTKLLVLGVPATIGVMILLFLLARLAAINLSAILLPLQVLVWAATIAFVVALAAGLSALIFGHPTALYKFMFPAQPGQESSALPKEKKPAFYANQSPRKILTQIYEQAGEKMTAGPFAGQASFIETFRDDEAMLAGDKVWFRASQIVPTEIACPSGLSAGFSCSLDANGRLEAYNRPNCGLAHITGKKVFAGCSRAIPIFDPSRPIAPIVQCCFYEDSPAARGLPFSHHFTDWHYLEN